MVKWVIIENVGPGLGSILMIDTCDEGN